MDTKEAGKIGGKATFDKYGREYFKQLRKKSRGRKKIQIDIDKVY